MICLCGKRCSSKAGLTLHQKYCDKAKDALSHGQKATQDLEFYIKVKYPQNIQEFIDLAEDIAFDMDKALSKNKSAGRRARVGLLKLRDMIKPLRMDILSKMQSE